MPGSAGEYKPIGSGSGLSASVIEALLGGLTYYVAAAGSDSNNGLSPSHAFASISKVNGLNLNPGDSVLFQGGQTFSGAIISPSPGTPARPITFGSYGGGQATISSGTSNGFTSTSQAGIIVRDLTFTGSASTNHGVYIANALSGNVHLQNIQLINLNVSGYGRNGIALQGTNGTSGYDDVLILGCNVSNCCSVSNSGNGTAGIIVGSSTGYGLLTNVASFYNIIIENCLVSGCAGTTDTNWTGSGILIGETNFGIIRNCKAINNGSGSNSSAGNGPVGIWTADSTAVSIIDCRSISNSTANHADGGGFDLDGGCIDCEILGCYAEGNAGPGFQIVSYSDGHVTGNDKCRITDCVSINDGGGTTNMVPSSFAIINNNAATNLRFLNCAAFLTAAGPCFNSIGSNAASTTADVIGGNFSVSSTQEDIGGTLTGIGFVGTTVPGFVNTVAASGQFPGFYLRINTDTHQNRALVALNGSDFAFFGLGPGGSTAIDTNLFRYGAGILGLSGGDAYGGTTTPASLEVFNSIDTVGNPSNAEWGCFDWLTTDVLSIGTKKIGSGLSRNIQFVVGGTNFLDYNITNASGWTFLSGLGIYTPYTSSRASSGAVPGTYVRVTTDTNDRAAYALDSSNNAAVFFGPGSSGFDTGLQRAAAHVVEINNGTFGTGPGVILPRPTTFANLPASPTQGMMASITDGLAGNCGDGSCTTFGTNVTGGTGALKLNLWYNGTHWTLIGK